MSPALRRSRRSKSSSYSVGDLVEIKRRSRSYTGRLVYRLTEDRESPNPLWLVTFDEGNVKDEEVYEKHFGAILKKGKSSRSGAKGTEASGDKPKRRNGRGSAAGESTVSTSSSDDQAQPPQDASSGAPRPGGRGGRRTAARAAEDGAAVAAGDKAGESPAASSAASVSSAPMPRVPVAKGGRRSAAPQSGDAGDRLSAREQRSLRRQAKIDEEVVGERGRGNAKRGYGGAVSARSEDDRKRARLDESGGECVKVKLLTGTLYLYKGLHRRAEFVRRY